MKSVAFVALLGMMSSGCSFIFVWGSPPPEKEPAHWPVCTETRVWPVGDLAWGLVAGAGTVAAVKSDDEYAPLALLVTVPAIITLGISTIYGFRKTGRCIDARDAYERAAAEGR